MAEPPLISSRVIFLNSSEPPLGRVTFAGYLKESLGVSFNPMRVFGKYAIVYLLEGSGRYADARGVDVPVRAGDAILVFPELAHGYGPGPGESWSEIYLVFEGPVFDLWHKHGLLDEAQPVRRLEPLEYWRRRWESVLEIPGQGLSQLLAQPEPPAPPMPPQVSPSITRAYASSLRGSGSGWSNRLGAPVAVPAVVPNPTPLPARNLEFGNEPGWLQACKLQEVLAEMLLHSKERAAGNAGRAWLIRACALLERDDATLQLVAKELCMSYESFRKRFAQLSGTSPAQYRASRALDRACEYLQQPDLGLKEIAKLCGFYDEFHFRGASDQGLGLSPSAFRQQCLRAAVDDDKLEWQTLE